MTAIGYTHFYAEIERLTRERDEAREQAKDWHDMEAVATDMYRNRADRLKRMVRIALRWRQESLKWMREHAEACLDVGIAQSSEERATARAEKAEASLAVARVELDATRARADRAEAGKGEG